MGHKLVFRCDAGCAPEIGTGHIARSLTLANELINSKILGLHDIIFYTRNDTNFDLGDSYFKKSKFKYKAFSNNELSANSNSEIQILSNLDTKIIILDRLETSKELIQKIKNKNIKVITFDDYGDGREIADLSISSIFDDVPKHQNLITGYEYLILSKGSYKALSYKKNIANIVATFGGNDARNLCSHFLDLVDQIPKNIKVDIILGKVDLEDIKKYDLIKESKINSESIKVHIYPENYHQIICNADIAISSGGLSIFEFSAYGVPTVGIPQYPHQLRTIKNLESAGISLLGSDEMNLSSQKLLNSIKTLIKNNELREEMSRNARKNIDGNGANRIATIIKKNFKDIF